MRNISYQFWRRVCLDTKANYQLHFQTCLRHSKVDVKSLQPLKVTRLSRKDPSKTDRHQGPSAPSFRPWGRRQKQELQFLDEDDTPDSLGQLAHTVSKYSNKMDAFRAEDEATRNLIRENRFIRARTIQRKYFKEPPPLSLLTWSAKEQIRFLHQQDPEIWSVKELAENFPVSESSIKKILKSSNRLYKNEDILRHDDDVQEHWLKLKASMEEATGDPTFDTTVYQDLKNSQNVNLVANATGIKHLPFPVKREKLFKPTGPFSSIVSDCYEAKEQNVKKEEQQKALSEQLNHISAILSDVSDMLEDKFSSQKHGRIVSRLTDAVKSSSDKQSFPQTSVKESHVKYQEKTDSSSKVYAQTEEQTYLGGYVPRKYKDSPFGSTVGIHAQQHFTKSDEPKKLHLGQLRLKGKKSETFISGDCVYDQNGEFLFRIP